MTKAELVKLAGIDEAKLDYVMPQMFSAKCYDAGIDPIALYAGWYYGDKLHPQGRPLPLCELWALAHGKIFKPTMLLAKTMLEVGAKDCPTCKGEGKMPSNAFDDPPATCLNCAPIHVAILDCEKGIGQ